MKLWREPARELEIIAEAEVVVCGGGPAGCAAALAAARAGADTLLIEREGHLGGATVNQLVLLILSKNAVDFQGVWHEWHNELRRLNAAREIRRYHDGIKGAVDPEQVKYAWDNLLSKAGVRFLHRALCAGAVVEGDQVQGVIVETCAGRQVVRARRVIDATGDGGVAAAAGVPFDQGADGKKYAMSLTKIFRLGRVQWPENWPTDTAFEQLRTAWQKAIADGELTHPLATESDRLIGYLKHRAWEPPAYRGELMSVMSRVLKTNPLDPFELTQAEREGREQARICAEFYRRHMPGFENSYLLDTAPHIGIRSSRRLRGVLQVTDDDVVNFRKYPHAIARASWDIDVWPVDSYAAPTTDRTSEASLRRQEQLRQGAFYEIRYGCLVPQRLDNLLFAGRCISASHVAESSLRIQQTCQALGEAAGLAAALSLQADLPPRRLDEATLAGRLAESRRQVSVSPEVAEYLPR